jgi:DNA-binding MarR family transcriptional regulator
MKTSHDDIIDLALELSRVLRKRMLETQGGGISFMRSYALGLIRESKDMTMKEFAKGMRISASSATAFIDRLVKERWVKRRHDPKNRKTVHLDVTALGEKMLAKHTQQKRAFLQDILTFVKTDDRKKLQTVLHSLLDTITESPR